MAEKLVHSVMQLSGNYNDLQSLSSYLKQNEEVLLKWGPRLDEVLNFLDPGQHTLGYTFILNCKAQGSQLDKGDVPAFLGQVTRLVNVMDRNQIQFCHARFGQLMRKLADKMIDIKQPGKALLLFKTAIMKTRPSIDHLTPIHPSFLMLCLASKNFKAALSILDRDILNVDGAAATPRDYMLFGYYGGMIYLGQKNWSRAAKLFEQTLTVPALALSAIMVESYKKYILASLLGSGSVPMLPKTTSGIVLRNLKLTCAPYLDLVNACSTHDVGEVGKVLQTHSQVFTKDKNFGLAKQAYDAQSRLNIQRLTKTFLTLSSADMASQCKLKTPKEAEDVVAGMIFEGQVYASINQKDGMVSFYPEVQKYDDMSMAALLDKRVQSVVELTSQLRGIDERISCSTQYLAKTIGDRFGMMDDDQRPPGMAGQGGRP
eukprot:TRINITY_DN891_c0_g1_i3.p1 TRINITY_DN891_c0_g1~~TRINITY_DN891_c0_g1_i3.p1  ORF type:complete len:430 (+),score=84.12 TRINITY_DN891_c0_g1_i3:71-1360(+)